MKSVFVVALLAFTAVCAEEYTNKYDDINIQEILDNKRLVLQYYKCIMDEGPCNAEGKELKSKLLEAIQTDCAKCSEKHKEKTRLVIRHLINEEPAMWTAVTGKYDPQGITTKKYEAELKKLKN